MCAEYPAKGMWQRPAATVMPEKEAERTCPESFSTMRNGCPLTSCSAHMEERSLGIPGRCWAGMAVQGSCHVGPALERGVQRCTKMLVTRPNMEEVCSNPAGLAPSGLGPLCPLEHPGHSWPGGQVLESSNWPRSPEIHAHVLC